MTEIVNIFACSRRQGYDNTLTFSSKPAELNMKIHVPEFANIVDQDEVAHNEPSHQDLLGLACDLFLDLV